MFFLPNCYAVSDNDHNDIENSSVEKKEPPDGTVEAEPLLEEESNNENQTKQKNSFFEKLFNLIPPHDFLVFAALQQYIPSKPFAMPLPGIRLGADLSIALGPGQIIPGIETGFVYSLTKNSGLVVESLTFLPIEISIAYGMPLKQRLFLRGGAAFGAAILFTNGSAGIEGVLTPSISLEYVESRFNPQLSLFFLVGADILFEKDRNYVLPILNLGLRLAFKGGIFNKKN